MKYRVCLWCTHSKFIKGLENYIVEYGICDDHYNTLMPGSVFEQENRAPFVEGPVDES